MGFLFQRFIQDPTRLGLRRAPYYYVKLDCTSSESKIVAFTIWLSKCNLRLLSFTGWKKNANSAGKKEAFNATDSEFCCVAEVLS